MEAPSSITAAIIAETRRLKDSYKRKSIEGQKEYTLGCILFVSWLGLSHTRKNQTVTTKLTGRSTNDPCTYCTELWLVLCVSGNTGSKSVGTMGSGEQ